jgi:hypothetical protein
MVGSLGVHDFELDVLGAVVFSGSLKVGMKTDQIQTDTAKIDTDNFSFSERILGSNTDMDSIFFVE